MAALLCGVLALSSPAPARAQTPPTTSPTGAAAGYRNFDVAVYARVYEVRQMADPRWLAERWAVMSRDLRVSKVYLETHRDTLLADSQTVESAKRCFTVSERRALVQDFSAGRGGQLVRARKPILIPQLEYLTNDSWELVGAVDGPNGWPMLHDADYGRGHLYVLAVPDNFADLYALPSEVLTRIRQTVMANVPVRVDGPAQVALFAYDNNTVAVESFLDDGTDVRVVAASAGRRLRDLETGEVLTGTVIEGGPGSRDPDRGRMAFAARLKPHAFRAFRLE